MKKCIVSVIFFLLSFGVTAFVGFYAAIFLIGPHSDILPEVFFIPVGIVLLILIMGTPVWVTRKIFNLMNKKRSSLKQI
jgi:hypothetical protein